MPDIKVTRRAVLYGTAASLTALPGPQAAEARPGSTAPPPPVATVDFGITANGEPLLLTTQPTLLGRLGHTLGLSSLPQPVPLVAHCNRAEISALPPPPISGSGHRHSD